MEEKKENEVEITVEKPKKEKKKKDEKVALKEMFKFADSYDWFLIFFGTIAAAASGAVMPALTLIMGEIIDVFNDPSADFMDAILKNALYFLYTGFGAFVVFYVQNAFWTLTSARQSLRLRNEYLSAILRQEIGWFDQTPAGELTTRISADTIVYEEAIGEKLSQLIQQIGQCIAGFVMGFVKGWKLALVMLAVTPLIGVSGAIMMRTLARLTEKGQAEYAKAGAYASEVISGIRTVSSFASEPIVAVKYDKNLEEAKKINVKGALASGLGIGVTMFIFFGVFGLALWYGTELVRKGEQSGGDVLTVFFSVLIGAMSIGIAGPYMEALAKGQGAAAKIFATIDRKTLIDVSDPSGLKPSEVKGDIELHDVTFRYPTRPESAIFKGVNLKIRAGEKVAFVGHSGAGKSTAIQLIQRFYDPESGSVTLDGTDIKTLNLSWLRQNLGLVGQEPVLFSGTIAENICYGKTNANQEEIEAAAKAANAHNFIMTFPDKYNTQVGEKGAQLSGGQKQRIAIARAIIKNPKILLLDEATSALDSESEKIVQDALDSIMGGRTTIIVAHRLSTIRDADRIFVISKGGVAESGSHDELMEKQGIYYELVMVQTGNTTGENKSKKEKKVEKKETTEEKKEEAEKEEEIPEEELNKVKMSRLFKLNAPEWPYLVAGAFAAACNGAVQPVMALLLSEMIEIFYKPPDEIASEAWKWSVIFVAVGVAPLTFMTLQFYMFAKAGQALILRLRAMMFRSILRQDIGWFDLTKNSTGSLTSRLASEPTQVEAAVGTRIASSVQSVSTIVVAVIIAFIYGWKLTLVVLAVAPLVGFANGMRLYTVKGYTEKLRKANELGNQLATEAIMNIRTIAAFTREAKTLELYALRMAKPHESAKRNAHITGFLVGLGQLFLFGSYTLSFWYGGKLVYDGEYTFGDVIKVFMAIIMSAGAVGQAATMAPDASKAKRAAAIIFNIVDRLSPIDSASEEGKKLDSVKGNIEFKDIHFRYPTRPDAVVFNGMNLNVEAGKVVALVGQSGCGKSSTVSLLERFYDPLSGEVLVDGHNIKDLNLSWWRKQVGLVGQEPVLFSGTIAENIAYAKPEATQEEIETAARAANAHNFIVGFDHGYNTQVGEKGAQLSGGQKQRIAIARAIVKDPKILLLDEATSALDTESEKVVQAALDSVMKGRTTIVIAHRLSTVRNADLIVVFEKGVVVEQGTHKDLMEKQGIYYNLVERQTV